MTNTIITTFNQRQDAENATYKLRNEGFAVENISIIGGNVADETDETTTNVTAGSVLGGVAGLLLGAGTFAVPGLGVVAAAGPLAGLISGGVAGGVIGALASIGVSDEDTNKYQKKIKEGKYILTIKVEKDSTDIVKSVVSSYGGYDIDIY